MTEEQHYESVLQEVSGGIRREGLWAKALASCNGDEGRAKHSYLNLRVEQRINEEREERDAKASVLRGDRNRWIVFIGSLSLIITVSILRAAGHSTEFKIDFVGGRMAAYVAYSFVVAFVAAIAGGDKMARPFYKVYVKLISYASVMQVIVILCSDVQPTPVPTTSPPSASPPPYSPSVALPDQSTEYPTQAAVETAQSTSFLSSRRWFLGQTLVALRTEYDGLAVRRNSLTPGDHEQLAKFNKDAAEYTRKVQEAHAEEARLQQ